LFFTCWSIRSSASIRHLRLIVGCRWLLRAGAVCRRVGIRRDLFKVGGLVSGPKRSTAVSIEGCNSHSETARCDTLQGRPCQLDGGIPPADGRSDPPPITFAAIDRSLRPSQMPLQPELEQDQVPELVPKYPGMVTIRRGQQLVDVVPPVEAAFTARLGA